MRKVLIVLCLIGMLATPAFAQNRGVLTNYWASWYNVSPSGQTITLPSNSRDVWIQNGSSNDVWVSISGATIGSNGYNVNDPISNINGKVFTLDGASEIMLYDVVTSSITLKALTTASPVSVVVTY